MILPLEFGFSMEQVAAVIGVSRGWARQLRTRFIRSGSTQAETKRQRGGRRRENMRKEEEAASLIVGEIKRALDEQIGRKTALASAYNLLHRHNWRKLAADKRHPQADVEALLTNLQKVQNNVTPA